MPVFRVQAPDGSVIKVEAADRGTAMRGAQEHYASKRSQPPKNDSLLTKATGFMANVNRGLGVGDEIAGAVQGAANYLQGKANPLQSGMQQQRATEDRFQATNPTLAALGRGVGNAGTMAAPIGQGAAVLANASRAGNMARGAISAGLTGAAYAAADRGTVGERIKSAGETARNPLVLGLGAAGGALAPAAARRQDPHPKAEPLTETVSRFDRAGVDPMLAAAGGKGSATMTNVVAENPIAGVATRGRLAKAVDQTEQSARSIAEQYGTNRGAQISGEAVKAGVNRFSKSRDVAPATPSAPAKASSFAAKADGLYERAFQPIDAAEARAVDRARSQFEQNSGQAQARLAAENESRRASYEAAVAAEQQRASLATARGASRVAPQPIDPWVPAKIEDVLPQRPAIAPTATISTLKEIAGKVNGERLSAMITDGRIKSILGALEDDAYNVRFGDIRELRTWVRNAQRDPTLRQGIPQAGLQRIESALTQDIYNSAERLAGPQALRSLQRADQFYRAGSTRIKKALQPFDSAGSGEGAYARIMQAAGSSATADAQKLLSLKRSLAPDEWGDVAANVVSELGRPGPGAAAAGGEGFSVATFVTNYNKMSPRGREVLFGAMGGGGKKATELRAALDNLASVADALKGVEKGANASKSFVSAQGAGTLAGLVNPSTAVPTGGVLATMGVTGEMMTNPAVVRWLARLARTGGDERQLNMAARQLEAIARRDPSVAPLYQEVAARLSRGAGTTGGTSQQAYAR